MDQDVLAEARVAFLEMREAGRDDAVEAALRFLAGGHRLAARCFGRTFGTLDAGAPADLVVLDYRSPTPLDDGEPRRPPALRPRPQPRALGDGRRGAGSSATGRLVTVDAEAALARAREAAPRLWARMESL